MKLTLLLSLLCISICASAQKKSPTAATGRHTDTKVAPALEEQFVGCWITRNPAFYLHLEKGGKFDSNDINRQKRKVEHLTGTWMLAANALVLNYNEVATQHLHFMMNKKALTIKRDDGGTWTKAGPEKCR